MFATSEISNHHKRVVRTEGKVQGLCGEVPDDVGGVTSPEGEETLATVGTRETVTAAAQAAPESTTTAGQGMLSRERYLKGEDQSTGPCRVCFEDLRAAGGSL